MDIKQIQSLMGVLKEFLPVGYEDFVIDFMKKFESFLKCISENHDILIKKQHFMYILLENIYVRSYSEDGLVELKKDFNFTNEKINSMSEMERLISEPTTQETE